nr:reverse transcriptase domain-containing protein [Tanacetum cinerariifolium]
TIHSSIKARILEAQSEASKGINTLTEMLKGLDKQFERKEDGRLYLAKRIWVPVYGNLRILIMNEAHATIYHSSVKCAPFEALYGRRCQTPIAWVEVGESKLIGPKIVQETTDKILQFKERLKATRDSQKSYAGNRRKPLEFSVNDKVLIKVSPKKGVVAVEIVVVLLLPFLTFSIDTSIFDIFNAFDKVLLNEITEVQTVFNQLEVAVQLYQIISQDIVNIVVNSSLDENTSVNVNPFVAMNDSMNYVEICNKYLELEAEHIKQHNMVKEDEYNRLSKIFSERKQYCITLKTAMQPNKEFFQKNNTSKSIEVADLNAQLSEKVVVITALKTDLRKLRGKEIIDNATTIALEMYTLDPVILAPHVKNNWEAHKYYLKHIMEQAAILREVVHLTQPVRNIPKGTNRPLLSSTRVNPSTSASRLKPSGNTKNDRILRTPSSNEKNKVEV